MKKRENPQKLMRPFDIERIRQLTDMLRSNDENFYDSISVSWEDVVNDDYGWRYRTLIDTTVVGSPFINITLA